MAKKILLTYGTFDMFHIGHLRLLKRLKKKCDYLIVGLSTDEFNLGKGKKTLIPYKQRKKILKSIKYVDKVIPEKNWKQKVSDVKKLDVDIFAMGDDWKGKFDFLGEHCKVLYLKRTKDISTTKLKKSLTSFLSIPKEDIIDALEILDQLKKDLE
jgi:glycerol-3-phosphate cytidylyltransferase